MSGPFSDEDAALLALGKSLQEIGYRFITATPATHALVNARPANKSAYGIADVFGWSRPFEAGVLPASIFELAKAAAVIRRSADGWRSDVRFSTLGSQLYAHSAFPTNAPDTVFFGPDTYRFARLLSAVAAPWNLPARVRAVDVGCGSGAGGIHLKQMLQRRCDVELVLSDINPRALRFAQINAALNGCEAEVVESDVFKGIDGSADIVIANPPYLVDAAKRAYRHGGGEFGGALSVRIVEESVSRLGAGGRLVLYTGSAIVDGADTFFNLVKPVLERSGRRYSYEEIDPDVFGEELHSDSYARADRIAVVALTVG